MTKEEKDLWITKVRLGEPLIWGKGAGGSYIGTKEALLLHYTYKRSSTTVYHYHLLDTPLSPEILMYKEPADEGSIKRFWEAINED